MKDMFKRRAFSLTELLVVVSVLMILISLLMPSLRSAFEKAEMVQCTSNMRQITLSAHIYAEDFDQWLPERGANSEGSQKGNMAIHPAYQQKGMGLGFKLFYYNYIDPIQFWCPSDDSTHDFYHNVYGNIQTFDRIRYYQEVDEIPGTYTKNGVTYSHSGEVHKKWQAFRDHMEQMEAADDLWNNNQIFCSSGRDQGRINPQITYIQSYAVFRKYKEFETILKFSPYFAYNANEDPDLIFLSSRVTPFKWLGENIPLEVNSVHGSSVPQLATAYVDGAIEWSSIPTFFSKDGPHDGFLFSQVHQESPKKSARTEPSTSLNSNDQPYIFLGRVRNQGQP